MKSLREAFASVKQRHVGRPIHLADQVADRGLAQEPVSMDEMRDEQAPTANLDRLQEELHELGLRLRKSVGVLSAENRPEEPPAELTIRGR
jgi:hypothetical protein